MGIANRPEGHRIRLEPSGQEFFGGQIALYVADVVARVTVPGLDARFLFQHRRDAGIDIVDPGRVHRLLDAQHRKEGAWIGYRSEDSVVSRHGGGRRANLGCQAPPVQARIRWKATIVVVDGWHGVRKWGGIRNH